MVHRSTRVNANLTKGSASTGDVLQLLREWEPGEGPREFKRRAVDDNLLGKASRSRLEDVVERVLLNRYAPEGDKELAERLARLARAGLRREVLDRILYYHAALAEHLLYRIATELVYDLRSKGHQRVTTSDVQRYLDDLAERGAAPSYSDSVAAKLGQSALTTLRDFGILEGKARKRIAPVTVPDELVGYVCYSLANEGLSAKRIATHDDWRLFLLDPREVEDAILAASARGYFVYRSAGDIRRFDWSHESLDDYVEFIAGKADR